MTPTLTWRVRLREYYWSQLHPIALRLAEPLFWIKRRVRPRWIEIEQLTGAEATTGEPLRIFCRQNEVTRHHFLKLMFATPPEPVNLGSHQMLKLFRTFGRSDAPADLAIISATEGQHNWLDDGRWFSIPCWVRGHAPLPPGEAVRRHDSVKTTLRLIRRHGYETVATKDEKLLQEYFDRMYVPYTRATFGEGASLHSLQAAKDLCLDLELVLLQKKSNPGEYLGGFLVLYEPTAPRFWSLGVLNGDRELVREGVLAALYYLSFQYLADKGFTQINLGGSRPFFNDGILRYKRRYQQRITHWNWEGTELKIARLTPAVKSFLRQNPFIFRSKGKVYGAVFADAPMTSEKIRELHQQCFHEGLGRLIIWVFAAEEATPLPAPPPEIAAQVELRCASQLVSKHLHLP
jgi:hypothetical protein